jgi:hypothetical protein
VRANTVYRNTFGIRVPQSGSYASDIQGNRAFGNTTGIRVDASGNYVHTVRGNTVYSNQHGLDFSNSSFNFYQLRAIVEHNLVYANSIVGMFFGRSVSDVRVINNTIWSQTGNAVEIAGGATGLRLTSNILHADSGYAYYIHKDSAATLDADYNLIALGAAAKVGRWHGRDLITPAAWNYAIGADVHSRFAAPQFVDPDGADNQLGYVNGNDRGTDDNFALQATSPAIDAGDPNEPHYR